jgi:hypothetical protein
MLTVPEPTATAAGAAALGAVVGLARPPRRRSGVS